MGVSFSLVCKDCKEIIELNKVSNAELVLPNILPLHKNHSLQVINEDDYSAQEMFPDFKEVDIWTGENGTLDPKYMKLSEWDFDQFLDFVTTHSS